MDEEAFEGRPKDELEMDEEALGDRHRRELQMDEVFGGGPKGEL